MRNRKQENATRLITHLAVLIVALLACFMVHEVVGILVWLSMLLWGMVSFLVRNLSGARPLDTSEIEKANTEEKSMPNESIQRIRR